MANMVDMKTMLEKAAKQFEQYANEHYKKASIAKTEDSANATLRKATVNRLWADDCRKAIGISSPIPLLLTCPGCNERHIDEGEYATKPHHTHACQHCGLTWRPAIENTVGVQFLPGFKNEAKLVWKEVSMEPSFVKVKGVRAPVPPQAPPDAIGPWVVSDGNAVSYGRTMAEAIESFPKAS